MSGLWRLRKIQNIVVATTTGARILVPYKPRRGFVNWRLLTVAGGPYIRPPSLTGVQARYKWDYSGGGTSDDGVSRIRAQTNCPCCSKLMNLVFSCNHHLIPRPSSAGDESESPPSPVSDVNPDNAYEAVSACHNCKTVYYFRPYRMTPLLGRFVEIGRVKESQGNGNDKGKINKEDDYGTSNGFAVHTLPEPPSASSADGGGRDENIDGGEKCGWGGSNLGKNLSTPMKICIGLDKFIISQHPVKKV